MVALFFFCEIGVRSYPKSEGVQTLRTSLVRESVMGSKSGAHRRISRQLVIETMDSSWPWSTRPCDFSPAVLSSLGVEAEKMNR